MRALSLALTALLILAALMFAWRGLQEPPAPAGPAGPPPPRYTLSGAEWVRLGRQGEPEFRAQAESIEMYADQSVQLRALTVDALGGWHSPWRLQAPSGRVPPGEQRLELFGDVRAAGRYAGDVPVTFTTERLWVDLLRREMRTEAPVAMESGLRRATARGLRADFSGELLELLNDVQVEYAAPG